MKEIHPITKQGKGGIVTKPLAALDEANRGRPEDECLSRTILGGGDHDPCPLSLP
jgi:hypothetical protein